MAQTVGGYTSSGVLPHIEQRLASPQRFDSCRARKDYLKISENLATPIVHLANGNQKDSKVIQAFC
jgi:hypothetical protein